MSTSVDKYGVIGALNHEGGLEKAKDKGYVIYDTGVWKYIVIGENRDYNIARGIYDEAIDTNNPKYTFERECCDKIVMKIKTYDMTKYF